MNLKVLVLLYFNKGESMIKSIQLFSFIICSKVLSSIRLLLSLLLFLLLTGYLKNKKKVNSKHYNGIKKVLITYVVISIITLFYRMFIRNDNSSLLSLITGIFSFQTAPYSWYVEMYIGLFFLIPFLNILYNNIKTKNEKNILIITLFLFSSFFPTICAIKIAGHSFDLLPNYWALLYPILMYYIGCFISEYQIKINKYIMFFVIMVTAFLSTFLLYFYAQNATVNSLGITEHYLFSVILSILIFFSVKTLVSPVSF